VHTTSELTRRHGRFLLTGVRLSSAPMDSPAPSEEEEEEAGEDYSCSPSSVAGTAAGSASDGSSISEYLTKTLPGWHVEDFLVDEATAASSSSDGLFQVSSSTVNDPNFPWQRKPEYVFSPVHA
jgi:hypothetical protein